MKCLLIQICCALSVLCVVSSRSLARPARNGMIFYQSAPGYYSPQRAMYVQYQSQPYRTHRRQAEEGGVAAFASGDTIAAGTYLKDCTIDDSDDGHQQHAVVHYDDTPTLIPDTNPELVPISFDQGVAPTVFLDESVVNDVVSQPENDHEEEEEIPFIPEEQDVKINEPVFPETEVKVEQPTAPETGLRGDFPVRTYPIDVKPTPQVALDTPLHAVSQAVLPSGKKNVRVEIEDDDDEDDDDDESFVPFHRNHGPAHRNSVPSNSFFPIQFSNPRGGAIAVANSFSTGKKGTASSHAIAYGTNGGSKPSRYH